MTAFEPSTTPGRAPVGGPATAPPPHWSVESDYLAGLAHLGLGDHTAASAGTDKSCRQPGKPFGHPCPGPARLDRPHGQQSRRGRKWWQILEPKSRFAWKLGETLAHTVFVTAVEAYTRGSFEQAADKLRAAGKLGCRDRRLGALLVMSLFKAGQAMVYGTVPRSIADSRLSAVVRGSPACPMSSMPCPWSRWGRRIGARPRASWNRPSRPATRIRRPRTFWRCATSTWAATPTLARFSHKIANPDANVLLQRGVLAFADRDFLQAGQEFAQAWDMEPTSYPAAYNLMLARLCQGQKEECGRAHSENDPAGAGHPGAAFPRTVAHPAGARNDAKGRGKPDRGHPSKTEEHYLLGFDVGRMKKPASSTFWAASGPSTWSIRFSVNWCRSGPTARRPTALTSAPPWSRASCSWTASSGRRPIRCWPPSPAGWASPELQHRHSSAKIDNMSLDRAPRHARHLLVHAPGFRARRLVFPGRPGCFPPRADVRPAEPSGTSTARASTKEPGSSKTWRWPTNGKASSTRPSSTGTAISITWNITFQSSRPADYLPKLAFEGMSRLADLFTKKEKWTTALGFLQRAHRVRPGDSDTLERLFHLYTQLKKPDEAKRILRRLREVRPNDPQVDLFEMDVREVRSAGGHRQDARRYPPHPAETSGRHARRGTVRGHDQQPGAVPGTPGRAIHPPDQQGHRPDAPPAQLPDQLAGGPQRDARPGRQVLPVAPASPRSACRCSPAKTCAATSTASSPTAIARSTSAIRWESKSCNRRSCPR